jgi:hypothetical protein
LINVLQDLARAWTGVSAPMHPGRASRPSSTTRYLIDTWNMNFFLMHGLELVLYKGRERRSGNKYGVADLRRSPAHTDSESDSDSSLTDSDESDDETQPYGIHGQARRSLKAKKVEKKRWEKERQKKRNKQKLRTYTLYLTPANPTDLPRLPNAW